MVKRIGNCTGCLNKGIDPNEKPCNICTRVDKPQVRKDSDGTIIEYPTDKYCLKKPFRELLKERITEEERPRRRRR